MNSKEIQPSIQAIRLPRICALTGMSRATVWRRSKNDPEFPKPFSLGSRVTVWDLIEVLSYLANRKAARGA